jgi:hypothetical protein
MAGLSAGYFGPQQFGNGNNFGNYFNGYHQQQQWSQLSTNYADPKSTHRITPLKLPVEMPA